MHTPTKLVAVALLAAIAGCSSLRPSSKPASTPAAAPATPAAPAAATTAPTAAETFFKVTDVSSGKDFYTRQVTRSGTAITFKEEKTGAATTLQNSQVLEIQREAYMAGLAAQVVAPAAGAPVPATAGTTPAPTPAAAAAPAPATTPAPAAQ